MLVVLVLVGVVLLLVGLIALGATLSSCQISDRHRVEAQIREAEKHIDQVVQRTWHDMVNEVRRHRGF